MLIKRNDKIEEFKSMRRRVKDDYAASLYDKECSPPYRCIVFPDKIYVSWCTCIDLKVWHAILNIYIFLFLRYEAKDTLSYDYNLGQK